MQGCIASGAPSSDTAKVEGRQTKPSVDGKLSMPLSCRCFWDQMIIIDLNLSSGEPPKSTTDPTPAEASAIGSVRPKTNTTRTRVNPARDLYVPPRGKMTSQNTAASAASASTASTARIDRATAQKEASTTPFSRASVVAPKKTSPPPPTRALVANTRFVLSAGCRKLEKLYSISSVLS